MRLVLPSSKLSTSTTRKHSCYLHKVFPMSPSSKPLIHLSQFHYYASTKSSSLESYCYSQSLCRSLPRVQILKQSFLKASQVLIKLQQSSQPFSKLHSTYTFKSAPHVRRFAATTNGHTFYPAFRFASPSPASSFSASARNHNCSSRLSQSSTSLTRSSQFPTFAALQQLLMVTPSIPLFA